jgi:hypothetical protein
MKTIWRIILILAVAAAIGGLTLLLVNNGSGSAAGPGLERPGGRQFSDREFPAGDLLEGFEPGMHAGRGESMEGGAFSWAETVKNIVVVAVLVAVVALLERLLKPGRARKAASVPVGAPPPGGENKT